MFRIGLAIVLAGGALVPLAGTASAADYSFMVSPDNVNFAAVPDQTAVFDGSLAKDTGGYLNVPFHVSFSTSGAVRTATFQAPESWICDPKCGDPEEHYLFVKWGALTSGPVVNGGDCHMAPLIAFSAPDSDSLGVVASGCGTYGPFPEPPGVLPPPNLGSYKWTITLNATPAPTPSPTAKPTAKPTPRPTPTATPRPSSKATPLITAGPATPGATPSGQVLGAIGSPGGEPRASTAPGALIPSGSPVVAPLPTASATSDPTGWIVIAGLVLIGLLLAGPEIRRTIRRRRTR